MIRKLTVEDKQEYIDHIKRTYNKKGSVFDKQRLSIDISIQNELDSEHINNIFSEDDNTTKNSFHIWAKFNDGNKIVQSFKTFYYHDSNCVTITSYKSETPGIFKPKIDLLPLLEEVMKYFECKEVYNFYLVRKLGFFEWKRNLFFEDLPPLNRYNCYFDKVISANSKSEHLNHRLIANNFTFPTDTGVVCMSLKQEYRTYNGKKILPDTREMYDRFNNKKHIAIIGYNQNTKKIGNYLHEIYSQQHQVITIGRDNLDFSNNDWQKNLNILLKSLPEPFTIILNIFDYKNMELQQSIFNFIWENYKMNKKVHIVVMGSLVHYADKDLISEEYFLAKKTLHDVCVKNAIQDYYECKLLLIEPGVVQSYIANNNPNWPSMYITDEELVNKILSLIDLNEKFMSVSLIGSHPYNI